MAATDKPMFEHLEPTPEEKLPPTPPPVELPPVIKKPRWLSAPEIGALVLSVAVTATLVLSALIPPAATDIREKFRNVFIDYETLGAGVFAYPTAGQGQYPFGSPLYVVSYDKAAPESAKARVEEIWQYYVPKLHALSDRHYDYYIEEIYHENPLAYRDSLATIVAPSASEHTRVSSGTILPNLKMVNEHLNLGELEIPYDLYRMLEIGKTMSINTNSGFNFFVGALSSFWDPQIDLSSNDDFALTDPLNDSVSAAKIARLQSYVPITEAEINQVLHLRSASNQYYVTFAQPAASGPEDLSITFGGIAKGYANDILEAALAAEELTQGFFRGGFSSNVAQGRFHLPQDAWHITLGSGLVGLNLANNIYAGLIYDDFFRLSNSGGDSLGKSYFIDDPESNQVYLRHHIIDVRTGMPANQQIIDANLFTNVLSSAEIDCLTTAMICLPYAESAALIAQLQTGLAPGEFIHGAMLVYTLNSGASATNYTIDFSLHFTTGYEAYLYQFNQIPLVEIN